MNKKGFTLIELMVVIVILAVVSTSTIVIFDQTDKTTADNELRETYKSLQRNAILFMDLTDSWRNQLNSNDYIFIKLNELENQNFVDAGIADPTTYDEIPRDYVIKIYIDESVVDGVDKTRIDSCVLDMTKSEANPKCIANSEGYACNCCNYQNNDNTNPQC